MRITFDDLTSINILSQFNDGIIPRYGRKGSTMQGVCWCSCGKCIGNLLLMKENMFVGFIDTVCDCGNVINFSTAKDNI